MKDKKELGLLLDLGRKFWPIEDLKTVILLLESQKLTHLQLHISDNEGFRLSFDDKGGEACYSNQEILDLLDFAREHQISIIPEFDAPGHLKALLQEKAEFVLPESEGRAIDVTNPNAIAWFMEKFAQFVKLFSACKTFHIGGDEFIDFRQIENYPYLLEKTRAHYGEKASGLEFYIEFINQLAEYLQAQGKKVRVWNDGFLRRDFAPLLKLNSQLEICYWTNWDKGMASAKEWLAQGSQLLNFCDNDFYYVLGENAGYSYPTVEEIQQEAALNKFSGNQFLNEEEMKSVKGTYFSVWADKAQAKTTREVLSDLEKLLAAFKEIKYRSK